LSEETMLGLSRQTMRIILRDFIAAGWIEESLLGKYKCYKTAKYRLNLFKIKQDLKNLGYESFNVLSDQMLCAKNMYVKNLTYKHPQNSNSHHLYVKNLTYKNAQDNHSKSTDFIDHSEHNQVSNIEKHLFPTDKNLEILKDKHKIPDIKNMYVKNLTYK